MAFPDFRRRYTRHVEAIRLAFVAFNAPQFADFVLERPTAIEAPPGTASCQVHHYSELLTLPSANRLFAV